MRYLLPLFLFVGSVFGQNIGLEQKLVVQDLGNGATFGNSVDIHGDTAVVAAWQDEVGRKKKQGAVYVFVRREGRWINQAKLLAFDGKQREQFGTKVAISGDTIVVGVPEADIGKDRNQGAAYVFKRVGDNWSKVEKLVAAGGRPNDIFGTSVAVFDSTILVGAPGAAFDPDQKIRQANGAIYVFRNLAGKWTQTQRIVEKDSLAFGMNLDMSGASAVTSSAGSPASDHGIFVLADGGTGWKVVQRISNGTNAIEKPSGHGLYRSVAMDGTKIITGGTYKKSGKTIRAAFVFEFDGGKFVQQARLESPDENNGMFAWSVGISGDHALVGGPNLVTMADGKTEPSKGEAHLYRKGLSNGKTVWSLVQKLTPPDGKAYDNFGVAVAIDKKHFVVGADNHDFRNRNSNEGTAYVFNTNMEPRGVAASATASARSGVRGQIVINLVLNSRRNGFTKRTVDGKTLFGANGVLNPRTKKLLEGEHELEYGCETPSQKRKMRITFSGGQRQRVAIACAMIHEPKILLLDEVGN